ncbi:hypothetical protein DNTS_021661, partial [Danionella cerebrum]
RKQTRHFPTIPLNPAGGGENREERRSEEEKGVAELCTPQGLLAVLLDYQSE